MYWCVCYDFKGTFSMHIISHNLVCRIFVYRYMYICYYVQGAPAVWMSYVRMLYVHVYIRTYICCVYVSTYVHIYVVCTCLHTYTYMLCVPTHFTLFNDALVRNKIHFRIVLISQFFTYAGLLPANASPSPQVPRTRLVWGPIWREAPSM